MTLYQIGCSTGKDSSALLLWAIHESGLPIDQLRPTICDTGNEDPLTYQHLAFLDEYARAHGIKDGIEVLIPALQFFPLVFKKGRFPSRRGQFCTQLLKIEPTRKWIRDRWAEGHEVVVLNGKRMTETNERKISMKDTPIRGFSDFWGCEEWSPLRDASMAQVLEIHRRHGVPLNPLYAFGVKRVGCFPCVNCGKIEVRVVAKERPTKIDQIDEWENIVEKKGGKPATFFAAKTTTAHYRTKEYKRKKDGKVFMLAPIREVVRWAQTTRGGEQIRLDLEEPKACFLDYNACE